MKTRHTHELSTPVLAVDGGKLLARTFVFVGLVCAIVVVFSALGLFSH